MSVESRLRRKNINIKYTKIYKGDELMKNDYEKILFTEEQIEKRVKELGAQISKDYAGRKPILLGILKGCFVFLADLARAIDLECEVRFLQVSSYGFLSVSSGNVKIGNEMDFEIKDRDIILVEDILDSGFTITALQNLIMKHSPRTLKICALLDKPSRRKVAVEANYLGFECPDEFVIGYGLDYGEKYRNLPFVAVLKRELYE
jgi:hypoxanthine phosphoribosyltransferase